MKYLAILALLLLIGCTGHVVKEDTIIIGGAFALTGYGAAWGTAEMKAVQLAIDEHPFINGKRVHLVIEDTQTDPLGSVTTFRTLMAKDIQYIIGPTWEASTNAALPVAEGVVVLSPSSYKTTEESDLYTAFSTYPAYGYEISSVKKFYEARWNTYSVLYNTEFFSEVSKDIFLEEAEKNNWEVLSTYVQDPNDPDYRSVLLKIQRDNPDAIYAPLARDHPTKGQLMKQMKELGIDIPVVSTSSTENNQLLKEYGNEIEGILYAFPVDTPSYESFATKYEAKYGVLPESPSAATAYDATNLLFDALTMGAETPLEVARYLHQVEHYPGASNYISFDDKGIVSSKDYVMKTVKNGEFEKVD
tara:strand:- start:128 stop:1207 length:1080 start_codon:yes stop_codon:yes gene_type:complete